MAPKKANNSKIAAEPKTPRSSSPEQATVDSDSDFPSEVLSSKKATKSRLPVPGSPDFFKLDAVTLSPSKANLAPVSRKLDFGQLTDAEAANTTPLRSPARVDHNKRSRKPSEKAAYMAMKPGDVLSDCVEETPKPKKTPKKAQGKGKVVIVKSDGDSSEVELISMTGPSKTKQASPVKSAVGSKPSSNVTPKNKRKQEHRSPSLEIVTPAPASTKQKDTPATKRLRLVPQSPEILPRPSEKSPAIPSKASEEPHPEETPLPSQSSDVAEEESGDDAGDDEGSDADMEEVDDDDVQDVLLLKAYKTLKKYPDCTLIPFRSGTSGQGAPSEFHLLQYSPLLEVLPGVQPKNFYQSVNFTAVGQFVNPTRDLVTCVINDKDRLVIHDTKRPAVFLTTGVVLTCNLISPTSNNQQVLVKKIQVIPVVYEYRRLINFLGARYGKTDLYGYVSPEMALTFSSRKEGSGPTNASPKKGSKFFMKSKAPAPSMAGGSNSSPFPNYRNFDDNIPIYDCRETRFRFDEESFSTLNNLPVLDDDLPGDALVSVAYTTNSFAYSPITQGPKTDTAIYFNVLFVLFLGQLPEESPNSENE